MPRHFELVEPSSPPPVWASLRNEAERAARDEPTLGSLLNAVVLSHGSMAEALSYQFARKIGDQELRAMSAREIAQEAYEADPSLITAAELQSQLEQGVAQEHQCEIHLCASR